MMSLGKLERVDPRSVWAREDVDFTPWLAENLAMLGETLGLDLELIKTEAAVGAFACDIQAIETGSGRRVIIENQLSQTDHGHLGQLITYAAGLDAAVIGWIAPRVRDEHREAIDFLNRHTRETIDFFMITLEVIRISGSLPAVVFNLAASPNAWAKTAVTSASKSISDNSIAYQKFYQGLIDDLREKYKFTNARAAQPQNWYSFTSGKSGIAYTATFAAGNRLRAELYIDVGDAQKNKVIFDVLKANEVSIHDEVGQPLVWERLDNRRASRISVVRENTSIADTQVYDEEIRSWLIQQLLKFKDVFGPRLSSALEAVSSPDSALAHL